METCVKTVTTDSWHFHKCGAKATVEYEGKWYCKRHDPAKAAARQSKKEMIWRAEEEVVRARHYIDILKNKLVTAARLWRVGQSNEDELRFVIDEIDKAEGVLANKRDDLADARK